MKVANYDETEEKALQDSETTALGTEEFSEENARELSAILQDFLKSYAKKPPKVETRQWLHDKLQQELPDISEEEIRENVDEIIGDIENYDKSLASLNSACALGKTKEDWLADTLKEASVGFSMNQFGEYLAGIDQAITEANEAMRGAIMTKEGLVSQNPNLDGFIAEQHHVNTFNMDAALKNSKYRALRLDRPEGGTFGKNSVDIRIIDKNTGKTVHRYQAKFYQDAKRSIRALDPSRYGNQQGLVAKGQAKEEIIKENLPKGSKKTITETIGGTDKVDSESSPLSKKEAKRYQENTQRSGRVPDKMSWNSYNTRALALNIGKQAGIAGVQAAAINTGMTMAVKVLEGEKIDGEKVIEAAITTGADAGVKAAVAGALKVGVERNAISFIPKGSVGIVTDSLVKVGIKRELARQLPFTMMACVVVENIKVISKFSKGEITATQTLDYLGKNTVAIAGSLAAAGKGAAIGATMGAIGGPIGAVIGGFVGGMVGAIAGSAVGKAVYEGAKMVGKAAVSVVKSVGRAAYNGARAVVSGVRSIGRAVGGIFGL